MNSNAIKLVDSAGLEAIPHKADVRNQTLLKAVATGDRQAFEHLYLRFHTRLAGFVWRKTGRADLVDEIVNEAFLLVWKQAASFRGDSRVSTWIIGIAYHCMLTILRAQTKHEVPTTPIDSIDARNATCAEDGDEGQRRELCDWLQAGLARLPSMQRTTIELVYFHGQTCNEVAANMDCATGTVKARLSHARVRLRNILPGLAGGTQRVNHDECHELAGYFTAAAHAI